MSNQTDIQDVVTNKIIELIEGGELPPWRRPWDISQDGMMPYNVSTKANYNGINILILWYEALDRGFSSNGWVTYKQAQALGGQVKKGEKSVRCIFFKPIEIESEDGDEESKIIPCRRTFSVFNLEQVDGLDHLLPGKADGYSEVVEEATLCIEQLQRYCSNESIDVSQQGNVAAYSPSKDLIRLPTGFHSAGDHAATFAHECIHSTGHRSRLDRFDKTTFNFSMEDESYAYEELIAELGAAFLCAQFNIQGQHTQHACYLKHWLGKLKEDKTFLFKASAAANKAFQLILQSANSKRVAA
ncbi:MULTISPECIES: ArdC family protein [Gilvimarinus]|uniref:ArdC family protein n=1 Tax=Gilvimarinus TaxID=940550 RepID=UPI00036F8225|nr:MULTISPECIES: ArdC-like ssDNA-binding domain-containing protein [Gilvimarinus]UTF61227.1 zincin-like metallopeptidase domain-containing protein [Gilvimarinus sp. DA14]